MENSQDKPLASLDDPIICVVGPTACGKTNLAQELAVALDGEVVSADSMQVYRGMDIGTGKIRPPEIKVTHHCIDIVDPDQAYSAALYQHDARKAFADISARGKRIILCGGTGFYVRGAIDDYTYPSGEQIGNHIRDEALRIAQLEGPQALWEKLRTYDPASAKIIEPNDVKRVARALEMHDQGISYADQKQALQTIPQLYPAIFIGMQRSPELLAQRIGARVDGMLEQGLVGEVKSLISKGFKEALTSKQAIGYKEIFAYLDGDISLDEAQERIIIATRQYAKRQRTWFRKDKRIHWLDCDMVNDDEIVGEALNLLGGI